MKVFVEYKMDLFFALIIDFFTALVRPQVFVLKFALI